VSPTKADAQVRRRRLVFAGIIVAASLAGYLLTCAIYPAPILPRQVTVPQLRALRGDSALAQLSRLTLRGRITDTTRDPLVPAGDIVWQSPAPETILPEGAMVKLAVSSGSPLVTVPDVSLFDLELARDVLLAAGLKLGVIDTIHGSEDFGAVLTVTPAVGSTVQLGTLIDVSISSGPAPVRVPDLSGLPLGVARDRLVALGFRVGTLTHRADGKIGTVLGQLPAGGEMMARGSAVNLTISGTAQ
jgi:beta-lactam-binding protein with PASTA domain